MLYEMPQDKKNINHRCQSSEFPRNFKSCFLEPPLKYKPLFHSELERLDRNKEQQNIITEKSTRLSQQVLSMINEDGERS